MYVLYHVLCIVAAGFLAAWALSLNDLRYSDGNEYNPILISVFIIVLLAIAFGVATLNV